MLVGRKCALPKQRFLRAYLSGLSRKQSGSALTQLVVVQSSFYRGDKEKINCFQYFLFVELTYFVIMKSCYSLSAYF